MYGLAAVLVALVGLAPLVLASENGGLEEAWMSGASGEGGARGLR